VGALLAGGVATLLGSDSHAAGLAIGVMAAASVLVTLSLVPGLQRSRAGSPVEVLTLPPRPVQTENVGSTAGVHSPFGP
jgi:hypothetical protein